ncbi:imm11 family protein [Desmospora activa]|uniref:Immunity MXAN-0049 protein domain-containing protein n=1 Tax=Desmospora activa DSM 45169 TaxID=1121389 RepID=A0A2T4Z7M6_9BACL|nr:DUF1629 domain-containing protein [Desmospora activa]PTM57896.1 hypothetical protein C8J48_0461 [Desmospora activa DSM 45169]
MKVWQLKSDLNQDFEDLQLVNFDADSDTYISPLRGIRPILNEWGEVKVFTIEEGVKNDFPKFWGDIHVPVVSEKALNIIHDLIEGQVEVLPLSHPQHKYFAIHVLNAIDAINYDNAVVKELSSGLRVSFKKYSFLPEKLIGQHIFKVYLDDRVFSRVFVSDEFKERVTSSSLEGYDFVEVWDSEKSES